MGHGLTWKCVEGDYDDGSGWVCDDQETACCEHGVTIKDKRG